MKKIIILILILCFTINAYALQPELKTWNPEPKWKFWWTWEYHKRANTKFNIEDAATELKVMPVLCSDCGVLVDVKNGEGHISHGLCVPCAEKAFKELGVDFPEALRKDRLEKFRKMYTWKPKA